MRRDPSIALETLPERRWREFLEARDRAWNSRDMRDGIVAGRAFAAFMREFSSLAENREPAIVNPPSGAQ